MNAAETALRFGSEGHLVGILCAPLSPSAAAGRPGFLFWNVGLLHRIGPHRLYVDLARRLASEGFASLRFDLTGLGDSEGGAGGWPLREAVMADLQAAMGCLNREAGVRSFVPVGLCSGADESHALAVADPRVAGAVLIDGYGYPTWRFRVRRYGSLLRDPVRTVHSLARRLRRGWWAIRGRSPPPSLEETLGWQQPSRRKTQAEVAALLDRGARLLYVYSGEVYRYYNYRRQFFDMFPALAGRSGLRCEYWPEADHTFSDPAARRRLVETVTAWSLEHFAGGPDDAISPCSSLSLPPMC